jgi:Domain of unknown function (DUF1843)
MSSQSSKPHVLYGVWIDEALKKNDVSEMRSVLQEARKHFAGSGAIVPQPLYGVHIQHCIDSGASREELQQLLTTAKAVKNSDLDGAIKKLEAHLGKS